MISAGNEQGRAWRCEQGLSAAAGWGSSEGNEAKLLTLEDPRVESVESRSRGRLAERGQQLQVSF